MDEDLLRQDGLGASLFFDQVVFAYKHPVGEVGTARENRLLRPKANQTEGLLNSWMIWLIWSDCAFVWRIR